MVNESAIRYKQSRLMIQLLLASEALFFAALIIAFVYFRNLSMDWSESSKHLQVERTGFFSIFLFASSGTIALWSNALRKGKDKLALIYLAITIVFGAVFLFGQATEYLNLFSEEVTIDKDIFGSAFFTLTGFHAFHVFVGLIILIVTWMLCRIFGYGVGNEQIPPGMLVAEWYWHFVDVVWIFVFFFVYLKPLI
ncbi:hypothetical protein AUTU_35520 [Aureibacter tunicatorum]|nr:hypothetical protein AUTU_35520 [Aureibacter tunicatorum]